jgi:hypothetical protein
MTLVLRDTDLMSAHTPPPTATVTVMATKVEWVIVVRLADRRRMFWCAPGGRRGGQDRWSPRETQALRFAAKGDAERAVAQFETNAAAKEYVVVEA